MLIGFKHSFVAVHVCMHTMQLAKIQGSPFIYNKVVMVHTCSALLIMMVVTWQIQDIFFITVEPSNNKQSLTFVTIMGEN